MTKLNPECKPLGDTCDTCPTRESSMLCSHPQALGMIDQAKVICTYTKDQMIFQAGGTPLGIFAVQEGLVKLEVTSENGSAHTIRLHGPGDLLGYRSLFANESYHANAVALENVSLCYIPKNELFKICASYPEVALRLMEHLSKDVRQAEEKWVDQMDKAATARVAEAVLFLNDHFEHEHWTRREIAQWAGTTPETVMRTLAQFEKEGLVDQTNRNILIRNRRGLEERARETVR